MSGYWTALVPASSATLLAGTLSLVLARRGRASRRAGGSITAGTWSLILGELSCWTIFGLDRLIILGVTGMTACILMLGRLRYANRLRAPLAAGQA